MTGGDTGLTQTGFFIEKQHTEDVAWVGRLPRQGAKVQPCSYGDRAIVQLAVHFLLAKHGRGSRRVGAGLVRAKPTGRG